MYWTLYKNMFDKNETKRGLNKEHFSSPKKFVFEFCLREVRSISQSFSDSLVRIMSQEKSILQIVTFDF
jgi:hypothetical protein